MYMRVIFPSPMVRRYILIQHVQLRDLNDKPLRMERRGRQRVQLETIGRGAGGGGEIDRAEGGSDLSCR